MEIALDTNIRGARQFAAGRVTLTFVSPKTGEHITLTAKCRAPKESGNGWETSSLERAKVIFIEVPNESGYNDKVAKVNSRGFQADPAADAARVYCAKALLAYVAGQPTAPGLQILEQDTCGRCGRALTDPVSIERGIGPECYGRETGSKHETKQKTERALSSAPSAPSPQPELSERAVSVRGSRPQRTLGWEEPVADSPKRDTTDKKNVPVGVGDWRARQQYLRENLAADAPAVEKTEKPCSQLTELPGTTWEDIFRREADRKGILL